MKKKFTLFVLAVIFSFTVKSQIILDQGDVAQPLTQFIQYHDTMPNILIQPGSPGANQTWDFSLLQHHTTDSLIFTNSQWTPYGSSFTNSNLCMMKVGTDTNYSYLKTDADSMVMVGQAAKFMGSANPIVVKMNPSSKLVDFPSTYQSSFTSNSQFKVVVYYGQVVGSFTVDSIKVKETMTTTSTFDAWGNLTTNLGTYNCLRAKVKQVTNDSIWAQILGNWVDMTATYGGLDSSKRYSWWAKDIGFVLAELDVDPVTDSVLGGKYLAVQPAPGSVMEFSAAGNVTIYPNPSSDFISINSVNSIQTIEVVDALGKIVKSQNFNNKSGIINIADLDKGIYIIRIKGEDGTALSVKKLIVQ
jgi:hypothetical protein